MGNYLLNGKYGSCPNNNAASTEEINCYVIGNEIWESPVLGSVRLWASRVGLSIPITSHGMNTMAFL